MSVTDLDTRIQFFSREAKLERSNISVSTDLARNIRF